MKKTVKFSGTKGNDKAYFTAILFPKNKEKLRSYVKLIRSSVPSSGKFGEKDEVYENAMLLEASARVEIFDGKIIIRILYTIPGGFFEEDELKLAKDNSSRIVEEIETLIAALEEE
jgi:hypothetical protein